MHRLLQDLVGTQTDDALGRQLRDELNDYAEARAEFLEEGWVQRENRWEIDPLREYALLLIDAEETAGADLANTTGTPLHALGDFAACRDLRRRAKALCEKAFEPDHPTVATSYSNPATPERALGYLAEARDLLRRAIAIEEKAFEPDHPTLAVSYSNLAMVEQDLGNLAEAGDLLRRAITILEK